MAQEGPFGPGVNVFIVIENEKLHPFRGNQCQMFCLEWETVKSSEPVKEPVQTSQSPPPAEKETVVTTQAEVFPPPVAVLQVSAGAHCAVRCPAFLFSLIVLFYKTW